MLPNKYSKLLNYINYFENKDIRYYYWEKGKQDEKGTITIGYPIYDETFHSFIQEICDQNIMLQGYLEYLACHNVTPDKFSDAIPTADIKLLSAILTYLVRQERFCDGAWANAISSDLFLHILYRLKEIQLG